MKTDMEYWKDGTDIIEKCLADAIKADPADVPFPIVGDHARIWHAASAAAYKHALEMMGKPKDVP